ncbi:hypothetical protein ACLMJK_006843 [Lecanora helva]
MATDSRPVCLVQYLRYGDIKTKKRDISLSLNDHEINYHICCQNDPTEFNEDFELFATAIQGFECLAVLHTRNATATLEALVPEVSVPILGKGFDGEAAHTFRVKPSLPDERQCELQLRPGEPFYVRNLCLSLVPEESSEHLVELATRGTMPSYDEYSQHVSQMGESQDSSIKSPQKAKILNTTVMETPTESNTRGRSPLIQQVAADILDGMADDQLSPPLLKRRTRLGESREVQIGDEENNQQRPCSGDGVKKTEACEMNPSSRLLTDGNQESLKLRVSGLPQNFDPTYSNDMQQPDTAKTPQPKEKFTAHKVPESEKAEDDLEPLKKRRRLSSDRTTTDESPDSSADKTREVALPVERALQTHLLSSHNAIQETRTPIARASLQTSPTHSLEHASSARSTRSALRESLDTSASQESGLRILFASSTSAGDSNAFRKFLRGQGVNTTSNLKDATCLCVGKGELKKTSKLISAVLLGLEIITEDWLTDSVRLRSLQDTQSYLARDEKAETQWGIKLDEAIQRGKKKIQVFQGWSIIFTPKAKKDLGKGFDDLKDILACAGAAQVTSMLPKRPPDEPQTLVIASQEEANAVATKNRRCFTKDLIGISILRGQLDIESDEFLVKATTPQNKDTKKRKR